MTQFHQRSQHVETQYNADQIMIQQPPLSLTEKQRKQNRMRMLDRVQAIWIDGFLEPSVQGTAQIALELQNQPSAIVTPLWHVLREFDKAGPHSSSHASIVQVYDHANGEVLILGEPGAGKTTLLLELARALLERARLDESHPIPVVFSLSSWDSRQQSLTEWLASELHTRYQVPLPLATSWIETDQVLPLLDGLDEVAAPHRAACVEVINSYRREHGLLPTVICSRQTDYLALSTCLLLRTAVVVQPLTPEQIESYLTSGGEQLGALRRTLHKDADLQTLACTPLMLNVLTVAYQETPRQELTVTGSLETKQEQIFGTYVQRMLSRHLTSVRTTPAQIIHQLAWLAWQMQQHGQTLFSLEQMQPNWLTSRQRQLYKWLAILFPACLIGVLISLMTYLAIFEFNSFLLIAHSLLGGGLGGLLSSNSMAALSSIDGEKESASKHRYRVIGIFGISVLAGLIFVLGYGHDGTSGLSLSIGRDFLLSYGLSYGLMIFVLCGIGLSLAVSNPNRAYQRTSQHTSLLPGRVWRRWWQHLTRYTFIRTGLSTGLIIGLSEGLTSGLIYGLRNGLSGGLIWGFIGRLLSVLIFYLLIWGFIGGLLSVLLARQGTMIRLLDRIHWSWKKLGHSLLSKHHLGQTLRAIILSGLVFGLAFGLSYGLAFGLSYGLSVGMSTGLIYWLLIGLFQGVVSETMDDQHRMKTGQGIRRSAQNGLILGLVSGVVCVPIYMVSRVIFIWVATEVVILWHIQGSADLSKVLYLSLPYGLVFGLACGLLVALLKGGLASFRHYVLRFLLWHTGSVPWRYARFLDYAAERILLRKVGGGYIFIHRLLLDYFAALETGSVSNEAAESRNEVLPLHATPSTPVESIGADGLSDVPTAPFAPTLAPVLAEGPCLHPCGHEWRPHARFCSVCGAPVPS